MCSDINYLIAHGAYGHPLENWFPWLKKNLQKFGNVYVPAFPTPEGQTLESWQKIAHACLKNSQPENMVLIGHSSGANLVLRMAEKTDKPYMAVITVCPFMNDLGNPKFDAINESFVHPSPDWTRLKMGARKFLCFAGDDDPYVPLAMTKEIANNISAECIVIKSGGHLNASAGFQEFPLLLQKIEQL
jgi:predicted alpha/beta hydrolase family esterase